MSLIAEKPEIELKQSCRAIAGAVTRENNNRFSSSARLAHEVRKAKH
jgi:hypothetical protein